jgi:hypothetical protein
MVAGYKKWRSILWAYMLVSVVMDAAMTFVLPPVYTYKMVPVHLFILFELVFITLYFRQHFKGIGKTFLLAFMAIAAVGYVAHSFNNSILLINGVGLTVLYGIYFILGLIGLYLMLKEQVVMQLETSEFFWVNGAIILYAAGHFILFLFHDYLLRTQQRDVLGYFWLTLHCSLNVIYRLLLAVAISRKNA